MSKDWKDLTREEQLAILFAPFPIVNFYSKKTGRGVSRWRYDIPKHGQRVTALPASDRLEDEDHELTILRDKL